MSPTGGFAADLSFDTATPCSAAAPSYRASFVWSTIMWYAKAFTAVFVEFAVATLATLAAPPDAWRMDPLKGSPGKQSPSPQFERRAFNHLQDQAANRCS